MKLHRAIILVVMMLVAVALIVLLTAEGLSRIDSHSLIALGVVVVVAAVSGVAFSWKYYSKRS
jgi:anaerobic C4-dicarboxylate transporter